MQPEVRLPRTKSDPPRSVIPGVTRSALARLRAAPVAYVVAWVLVEAGAGAVLAPVAAAAVNRMIRSTGRVAVANEDIVRFVLSAPGAAAVALAALVALFTTGLARAATMLIAHECAGGGTGGEVVRRRGLGMRGVLGALRRAPVIASLITRQSAVIALIAAPFATAIGLVAWLTVRGVDLYWLVNERPVRFWVGLGVIAPLSLAMLGAVVPLWLRWTLAMPLCVLEGRGPRAAMRESAAAVRGRLVTVGAARLGWIIGVNVVFLLVLGAVHAVSRFVLESEVGSLRVTALVAGLALLAHAAVLAAEGIALRAGDALLVFALWRRWSPGAPGAESLREAGASDERRALPRWALAGGVVAVAVGAAAISAGLVRGLDRARKVEVAAHRGAARAAPENTLTAVREAIRLGADRVEIDVMLSRDGALVVFHDTDLRRIAGDPRRIADLTLEELRVFDVGAWFGPAFAGERMPTLEELLDATEGFPLNVELKTVRGNEERLAQDVAAALRAHGDEGSVITSLSARALEAARRADPSRRIGIIVSASVGGVHRLDVDLYSVPSGAATAGFISAAARQGRGVYVWSVSDAATLTHLAFRGVDGVITSDVEPIRARLDELQGLEPLERLLLAFRARVVE